MFKKIASFCFLLYLFINVTYASSAQEYLAKYNQFNEWYQHLPIAPQQEFLDFISQTSPLSQKLREKWLYELARKKDWSNYTKYYQYSNDPGLQCYALMARYDLGPKPLAVLSAKTIWRTDAILPKPCDLLFSMMFAQHEFDDSDITERLVIALDKPNLPLATYLLKQYKPARLDEILKLMLIHQNPKRISLLSNTPLHREFFLYGLKRMVIANMDLALQVWQRPETKSLLKLKQQQAFLAHIALFKAMRNHPDTQYWFAKIKPDFYNETLLDWQIRFALKYKQWHRVRALIGILKEKDSPCWQYWMARALEAQGQKDTALGLYQTLAKTRNYYGFLASHRLKQHLSFDNERTVTDQRALVPYRSVIEQIRALYFSKQYAQASRIISDFASELPKEDKSALAYWVEHSLQWHSKAIALSSTDDLNNQLSLRFPLSYHQEINAYAKNYQIAPELIYAIIRQESSFRDDVTSSAGARGLMQVMPTTATLVAKQHKIPFTNKKQLFSSEKNIHLGTAYLKQLAKQFASHPILMIAAYNAGPRQAANWLRNYPTDDIDIWIETLPWLETRNYLKNVISFYAVYQYRLQARSDFSALMRKFSPK